MKFLKKISLLFILSFLYIVISNGLRLYSYIETSPVVDWADEFPDAVETFQSIDLDSVEITDEPLPQVAQERTQDSHETDSPVAAINEPYEVSPYDVKFERLHQQTLTEIKELANEFKNDLANQENALSQSMLFLKYEKKARDFEEEIDLRFDGFLEEVKEDTSDEEWNRLEKKYTRKYEQAKKKLVDQVMEKANELFTAGEAE
ncbi:hypothetical protein ACFFJI_10565 [Allobacillus sp. GCM10007491]|uniref:Uncharacterized protein n=1 Tax=Allobacillus saliphilus TaxID=2912308 RepID=A0A941CT58_9BACI|nr:hypothetical protein [Allobacillus saliphilus]MBR7552666.1 hypothetical protein [Allobacillus saliphilus]